MGQSSSSEHFEENLIKGGKSGNPKDDKIW